MRELSIGGMLSTGVKTTIKEEKTHPTQEVKSNRGTGVGLSKETDLRVNEQGPKEKV